MFVFPVLILIQFKYFYNTVCNIFHSASVSMPIINKTSIRTNSSLQMTWQPDMENNGDFEIIGFNVTFTEIDSQKVLYESTVDFHKRLLFVENLKPYFLYQLNVSAFNRFHIHSHDAKQNLVTSQAGKIFFCRRLYFLNFWSYFPDYCNLYKSVCPN